jgi:hypothetical protein
MTPEQPQSPVSHDPVPGPAPVLHPVFRWYHKMAAVSFVSFCLTLGFFLLLAPWTDIWDGNFFSSLVPEWHQYWENMYVRGAVSGLGVIDLYISFLEILRLRRFSRH